jgi:cytoskeletal protein CcmA (bactofilin family)
MAWFDRNSGGKKGTEPEKTPELIQSVPEPAPTIVTPKPKVEVISTPAEARLVGHLYKGSRITGQLTFEGSARIDGSVEGEIKCQGTLTIGEGADVRAKVSGQIVVIRGKLEGNVTAKERVELLAPGRLFGNMAAPRLIITEGVVFDGDCSMGAAKEKAGVVHSKAMNAEKIVGAQAPKLQNDSSN